MLINTETCSLARSGNPPVPALQVRQAQETRMVEIQECFLLQYDRMKET